ncbi:ABC transporter substrate-binding protein [Uliginosibacterium aquaticum]|uniref:ABC transporter substrate-binding protein n=1 Tax=Uliginosibacterium aquaticum TaxID=2731212 RepID=A0ABX2IDC6_9RHOO|nr:ABC transporter substrate-binding protein [Uliginosibacterium aquaticum]NSL54539.1 ABC transporter substrate-binding protein [Uliginosibacterium aquaticum]
MLRVLLASVAALLLCSPAFAVRSLTDLAGRTVKLPDRVERVVIGEGRFLIALGLLEGAALPQRVVGMMGEFERLDPDGFAHYLQRFPALAKVARVGLVGVDSFSVEQAIALRPQLVVFGSGGHGPSPRDTGVIARLEAAGIAVMFIDFRSDPLLNTPRSMRLLGEALGREKEAAAYVAFYEAELAKITAGLKGVTQKPRVFLESRVGLREECCETMVGGMMGRFVDAAGGDNLARPLVPGEVGQVNLEYLLSQQPEVYVATAVGNSTTTGSRRILMGDGAAPEAARASLQQSLKRPGISGLRAVRSGRAHAIWHHFYDSPLNVVAVQAFASWFHPQRFATLDPVLTLRTLYERFQPLPLTGTYWVSVK